MKIALFGGTFDPPHLAHTQMVKTLLDQGRFDQIWFVPVAKHQEQFAKEMSSVEDRVAMLKIVKLPGTKIETCEIEENRTSHTHTDLKQLNHQHPQHHFSWLMGSDQLVNLHLWNCDQDRQCFPRMADEFDFYVYPRVDFDLELPFDNLKLITDVEPMAVSSTEIRDKVKKGESITGLVDPKIEAYIQDHHLYN